MWAAETKAKIDIPLENCIIKKGEKITITRRGNGYCLQRFRDHIANWHIQKQIELLNETRQYENIEQLWAKMDELKKQLKDSQ